MFNQENNEEKKLDWMYKGPNSTVDREEYLLGRAVDKTLENLNNEEKQKQQPSTGLAKSRVEHECIPPSIRDFNKVAQAEQVDLSAKLQEDPLVTIKKREEESRRQFLQNPVQLKKLQKALKAQEAIKKKKKKKKSKESDLDAKLKEKLLGIKSKKVSKEEKNLDIILMHKYEALKHKLSDGDIRDILNGEFTDSDSDEDSRKKKSKKSKKKRSKSSEDEKPKRRDSSDCSSDSDDDRKRRKSNHKYDSDSSDSDRKRPKHFGLVNSQGNKISLSKNYKNDRNSDNIKPIAKKTEPPKLDRNKTKKLSETEKEKMRQEMMQNAAVRDKERERNVRKYRADEEKETKDRKEFDSEFAHRQFAKSTQSSSVESRIKSNINNIQRSSRDMDKNFSKRH